ncbi:carboxypeptidase-like regulatory domain-containing protein [Desertivirga brevis]|uniref:carboxypeptidase-like regulatory domain-containing protein n=1 Tax=Desertivirga brevis TaxID=2810310 RepID=UPI001A95AF71|nr:carboxypeptidase-like regulatory domain-containing protein [Pedobacter sp. SYSU D00873]
MPGRTGMIILIYLLPFWSFAQTLRGTVYREGTDSVLVGASVYFGGSTGGTITNAQGQFALEVKADPIPLVISYIGYYSVTINSYNPLQRLKVYLKPKQIELKEVAVSYDGMSREQKMKIFLREFIGASEYAKSCVINNAEDIDFRYDKKERRLSASCNAPLDITNKKLGYTIQYFLDSFMYTPDRTLYAGNFIFKEDSESRNNRKIRRNRALAYEGSRMQFIRSLWKNDLEKAGFTIYRKRYEDISADTILASTNQHKYLLSGQKIQVLYKQNRMTRSQLTVGEDHALIGRNGFFDTRLSWSGAMANQRIGDLLPFEYEPSEGSTLYKK